MKALSHPRSARVPPSETLTPTSHKQRPPRVPKENVEPNAMPLESSHFRSPPISAKFPTTRNRSLLPPRPPPSSNPLKRKLSLEALPEKGSPALVPCDSGVQVVVRMKPLNNDEEEGNQIAQKISPNSISILDHTFTFDSVADASSTQQDIFQLVGVSLVENCLAGFNSSIFAYGQTGSGKTYTMWGPPCALAADGLLSQERGLTPRVFELLFSRINEEEAKHSDKQLSYQCRCSFLEIYNEQIIDLLDPSQRNLLIREDVKAGVYVDFLTEDYVCQMKDVVLLLLKGLSNRRIGATSINAESSRSHCVFTCAVECRLKSMADGLSSLRTSRINLVDLAGSERQKATHAAGDRLKEAGNINRSLSQLGNIINILAEVSQSGKKYRHIPYRDSRLTFLLQESLGGNAKLAMICAISSSQSCKGETFSTLRFAQRAKAIKNQAVVNETTEDDVNVLREEIRQLKDELLRIKSNDPSSDSNKSTGWNVQRSLNLLRLSLYRPRTLPVVKDDSDEEMEIVEEDLEINCVDAHSTFDEDKSSANEEISSLKSLKDSRPDHSDTEDVPNDVYPKKIRGSSIENDQNIWSRNSSVERCEMKQMVADECRAESQGGEMAEIVGGQLSLTALEEGVCQDLALRKSLDGSLDISEQCSQVTRDPAGVNVADQSRNSSSSHNHLLPCSLNIVSCEMPLDLPSLTLSNSSMLETCSRKSLRTSLISASQKGISAHLERDPGVINVSFAGNFKHSNSIVHPTLPGKNSFATTEHLAASLYQGLQVIDSHRHSLSLRNSSFRFSLKTFDLKLLSSMNKVDIGIQTLPQQSNMAEDSTTFICNYCKNKDLPLECSNNTEDAGLQIVPIDDFQPARKSQSVNQCKKLVPKAVEKVLAGAIRREMALEGYCTEQAAEIMHLNRLVQQYRHERECATIIEQTSQDKICRLEGLMDGVIPTEEFMEEEFISLRNEHMMLKGRFQNHPEVFRLNIELKRIQNELDGYRNFFDMGERDVLMEEIQDLRYQLQYFIDSYSTSTCTESRFLQLAHLTEPISAPLTTFCKTKEGADETETISAPLTTICKTKEGADEILEHERRCWTEKESKWISLSEELRTELKASCSLADKLKTELESERKCTKELKEALQTALEVHTRALEQYAEFEEKHIALLGRHRKMREGITDVKNAAARAGVKGAGSRFIESLATQIEALRADREKEKRYWRDENKGLQTQLRDTAEAVEAAGELLCRLKEAEQATAAAQKRALAAEQMIEKVYQETDDLKNNYEREIATLNQLLAESRSQRECQNDASSTETGLYSWFHNYDRCNI